MLAELVAQGDVAVRRQGLAYPPQVAHRVYPEIQDVAGQHAASGRVGGHLLDIAGDQGSGGRRRWGALRRRALLSAAGDGSTPTTQAAGQAPIGSLDPRLQQEPLSSERCPDSR